MLPILKVVVFLTAVLPISGEEAMSIYDFTVNDINGKEVHLREFSGKVVMIVNVASKCGFTYQYEGLQKLYEKYKESGFVILGFPANNFLRQEPGTNDEIQQFCKLNYGVSFPMFEKISVAGRDIHPLYAYLTSKKQNPEFSGKITWNFNKFLVDKEGEVVGRFPSKTEPLDPEIVTAVENALH